MIEPKCDHCGEELRDHGGLIFSPPHKTPPDCKVNDVRKFHICQACWKDLEEWIMTPQGGINAMIGVCQDLLKLDSFIALHESFQKDWEPLIKKARMAITYKGGGAIRY